MQSNCKKLLKNCGPGLAAKPPQGATSLHRWLRIFLCLVKDGPQVSQLLHVTLNITMELKHEPKAAGIVIQFVLLLGDGAAL